VSGNVSIVRNAMVTLTTSLFTEQECSRTALVAQALGMRELHTTVAGLQLLPRKSQRGRPPMRRFKSSLVVILWLDYTDSNVQSVTRYYYVTRSVNSSGNERSFRNEVSGNNFP